MPHDRRSKNLAWPLEDWNLPRGKWSYYGHVDMKNLDQRLGEKNSLSYRGQMVENFDHNHGSILDQRR